MHVRRQENIVAVSHFTSVVTNQDKWIGYCVPVNYDGLIDIILLSVVMAPFRDRNSKVFKL